jgi:hypothetical protein
LEVERVEPPLKEERDGNFIHFSVPRAARPASAVRLYLHDVWMFIRESGTSTDWNFFKDGEVAKDLYFECTSKHSPQAAAVISTAPPPIHD